MNDVNYTNSTPGLQIQNIISERFCNLFNLIGYAGVGDDTPASPVVLDAYLLKSNGTIFGLTITDYHKQILVFNGDGWVIIPVHFYDEIIRPEWFGARGDGKQQFGADITGTTVVCAEASFNSSDVGKQIVVSLAGAGGWFLKTTIVSVTDTNTVEVADAATANQIGVKILYGTDDTEAIQKTINYAKDNRISEIRFRNAIYILAGDLQNAVGTDGIDYNSILYIPYQSRGTLGTAEQSDRKSVMIRGSNKPCFLQGGALSNNRASIQGTTIIALTEGSGTEPSIICSRGPETQASYNYNINAFNFFQLYIEDVQFMQIPNSSGQMTLGYINAYQSVMTGLKNLIGCGYDVPNTQLSQPVSGTVGFSAGMVNCFEGWYIEKCNAMFVDIGYKLGEHGLISQAFATICYVGFRLMRNYHAIHLVQPRADWCAKGFLFSDNTCQVIIEGYQGEWRSDGKWYDTAVHVEDYDDYARGNLSYSIVETGGIGNAPERFLQKSARNLYCFPIAGLIEKTHEFDAAFTIENLDFFRNHRCTSATDVNVTIPVNSGYYPGHFTPNIGDEIKFIQGDAGAINIVAASGVTIYSKLTKKSNGQGSIITLTCLDRNIFQLSGEIATS